MSGSATPRRRLARLALVSAMLAITALGCSSPTGHVDCTAPGGPEGIVLSVVADATGASLAAQAVLHVLAVDPPKDEVVGPLSADWNDSPLRAADRDGVYELLVEVPGYDLGFARVTVPREKKQCGLWITQHVTIRMTPA